jgi:hypothetical protein
MRGFGRKAPGLQPPGFTKSSVEKCSVYSSRSSGSVAVKEATMTR